MAFPGVYYFDDQRSTIFLYGNFGTISCQNIYGGEKTSYLFNTGEAIELLESYKMPFLCMAAAHEANSGLCETLNKFLAVHSLFILR